MTFIKKIAILFMLAGLPLGIAVNEGGRVIALFFLLSAFYFAYSYYNQQLTVKNLSSGMKKLCEAGVFRFFIGLCRADGEEKFSFDIKDMRRGLL